MPWVAVLLAAASVALGGCSSRRDTLRLDDPDLGRPDAGPPSEDLGPTFPDTGIGRTELEVLRVVPDHGPFRGGTVAVLRGSGFTEGVEVTFGGRLVQPADVELIDSRRLQVVVPAGDVGPVDVTVRRGDETYTLADGYTYDAIYVEPSRGSVAGGTFVSIVGDGSVRFRAGDVVTFGRASCTGVEVVSETRITCRTPPLGAGTVDVTVTHEDGTSIVGKRAYTYYDTSDPFGGGLGGGPVAGTVNVTVLDAVTGNPVPGVCVFLGDGTGPYGGETDLSGRITLSGPDLMGPQVVTAAKDCFEKTTFVSADASEVTIFLVPWTDPRCGMGMGEPPPPRPGRRGAFVSGSLIWRGPNEFSPNPWRNIPPPRANEVKVAYVYATRRSLEFPNPDPASGAALQRVLEVIPDPLPADERGYPYKIFVNPGAMAVYALAGLENLETGEFIPYVMGIARNVLAGPGESVEDQDMEMNIPLDHHVDVALSGLPARARSGPDRFKVEGVIDLGGEGYIVREVNDVLLDVVRRRTSDRPFRLVSQPALFDALSDGRYRVKAGWYTGAFDGLPFTYAVREGVRAVDATVEVGGFLGIPAPVSPEYGATLPADRVLRWRADGPTPSLHVVLATGGDGNPAWRQFLPGNVREAPIPDTSRAPTTTTMCGSAPPDIATGDLYWQVYAIEIPGFSFDSFSYAHLSDRYWSKAATDFFVARVD